MNKILSIFKVSFFIEILIGSLAVCLPLVYDYNPQAAAGLLIVFVPSVITLIITLKLAIATGKGTRLRDELSIVGHIVNTIKLLLVLLVIGTTVYIFVTGINTFTPDKEKLPVFIGSLVLFLIWSLASLYNFAAYVIIAKANRKADVHALYDFW
jgi:hypothetical protein